MIIPIVQSYTTGMKMFWTFPCYVSDYFRLCIQYYRFVLLCIYNLAQGVTYIAPWAIVPSFLRSPNDLAKWDTFLVLLLYREVQFV